MNIKSIGNAIRKTSKKGMLSLRKHSPEILMVVGIAGTVAGTVVACKATTKLEPIMNELEEKREEIKTVVEDENGEELVNENKNKELAIAYAETGVQVAKAYAPAAIIMTLSLSSILAANNILRKRNFALMTAYATLNKTYADYRERVSNRYGKDVEEEIRYGIEKRKITEEVVDENGKKKNVKKEVEVSTVDADNSTIFEFSKDTTTHFDSVMDYNRQFLSARQSLANDMLVANGYLFLNEVLDLLDLDRTADGFMLGWIFDPDNNEVGDNEVLFRARESFKEVEDIEGNPVLVPIINLDFNYDGVISDTKALKKAVSKNSRTSWIR